MRERPYAAMPPSTPLASGLLSIPPPAPLAGSRQAEAAEPLAGSGPPPLDRRCLAVPVGSGQRSPGSIAAGRRTGDFRGSCFYLLVSFSNSKLDKKIPARTELQT